jgi:acyl-CoA synthetase (AMP-forming)/AMP-acid ligase II
LLWLGILASGCRVSATNPAYTSTELKRHFELTKPKCILAQASCMEAIVQVANECGIPNHHIFHLDCDAHSTCYSIRTWRTLLQYGEYDYESHNPHEDSSQYRVAVYAMTSGTTGLPKAAMISHRYMVAQTTMLEHRLTSRTYEVLPSQTPPPQSSDIVDSRHNSSAYLSFTPLRHLWHLYFPYVQECQHTSFPGSAWKISPVRLTDLPSPMYLSFHLLLLP